MADLSHWIYAKDFTAREAALLIMGADPSENSGHLNVQHIYDRMSEAYSYALKGIHYQLNVEPYLGDSRYDEDEVLEMQVSAKTTLMSLEMEKLAVAFGDGNDHLTKKFMARKGEDIEFKGQRFSRAELARWIKENGLLSAYPFAQNSTGQSQGKDEQAEMEKPLTKRERDTLLTIIAILCEEAKYDYKKHAKAANLIQDKAASMGISIGETTIEGHLKKIPNALATRKK